MFNRCSSQNEGVMKLDVIRQLRLQHVLLIRLLFSSKQILKSVQILKVQLHSTSRMLIRWNKSRTYLNLYDKEETFESLNIRGERCLGLRVYT
jgi:hypothetical protein